tara:strand:- start:53 stop:262 length:210 start_codon:yes stop_codon:yes gene_type:complete
MTEKDILDNVIELLKGEPTVTDGGEAVVIRKKSLDEARTLLGIIRAGTPEIKKAPRKAARATANGGTKK